MTPRSLFVMSTSICISLTLGCSDDPADANNISPRLDMSADIAKDIATDISRDITEDQTTLDCTTSREPCKYPQNTYKVTIIDGVTVTSNDTGRELPIRIRYPSNAPGRRPFVIWSHGGDYNNDGHKQSKDWGAAFANHGFVVIQLAHVEPTNMQGKTLCALANVPQGECVAGNPMTGERPFLDTAVARPYDIKAVLDALPMIAQRLSQESVQVDTDRVGLVGWSAGSQAPLALLGASRDISASVKGYTITDERVTASIALSPQGPGDSGFTEMSYAAIKRPVLVMTGDNDVKAAKPELTGARRKQTFERLSGGRDDHYLLYSLLPAGSGAHGTYNLGDLNSQTASLSHLSEALVHTALAYFDAYLLDDANAKAWLKTDAPRQLADNQANWSQK